MLAGLLLFGTTGLLTLIAMFALFLLPAYLILSLFDFKAEEKLFFSFAIGLGMFPLVVWYLNRIIPSLKLSLLASFILVVLVGIYLRKRKKKQG